jgi:endonuclease G
MSRRSICMAGCALAFILGAVAARATDLKPIVIDSTYHHDKYGTEPKDIVRHFRAYTTSFDSADDDDGNGRGDRFGVPEWVAYELRATPVGLGDAPDRPSPWITDDALHEAMTAPDDDSYKNSGYSRGHMCMKNHAFRLGADADWNTHTVLNACPQLQCMNGGAWLGLENMTGKWADKFDVVWIVAGPVFFNRSAPHWIGDPGEVRVAVPDAFYKIVIKESDDEDRPDVLAFLIPMEGEPTTGASSFCSTTHELTPYLTSVDVIEALTGLDFLTVLPDEAESEVERVVHYELWPEQ